MKLNKAICTIFVIILICSCKKNKDFNLPELLCSTPSEDIQFVRNSIIGEWKSIENNGVGYESEYESIFVFTDSTQATKTIQFNNTNEESEVYYNYSIEPQINSDPNIFTINLLHITPSRNSIKFCKDEFIMFNEELNFWERYERN